MEDQKSQPITDQDIERKFKRAQKVGLDRNSKFIRLWNIFQAIPEDANVLELIDEMIKTAENENLFNPNPFRATNPNDIYLTGNIGIGIIPETTIPYMISPELLKTHFLIIGRTGGGKSNLIFLILAQLLEAENHD